MSTRLYAQVKASTSIPTFTPVRGGLLQRKCACGGTPGLDGLCAECRSQQLTGLHPLIVQTKLTIGQPSDKYEREANRVADMVMRLPEPRVQRQGEPMDYPWGRLLKALKEDEEGKITNVKSMGKAIEALYGPDIIKNGADWHNLLEMVRQVNIGDGEIVWEELSSTRVFWLPSKSQAKLGIGKGLSEENKKSETTKQLGWTEFTTGFILDHAHTIKREAKNNNIDPVAIAGVVAWEREENPRGYWSDVIYQQGLCKIGWLGQTAGIGYGSIHLNVAEAIEKEGKVPAAKDLTERCKRLQDPTWAIRYIAAIMNQDAENYERIANISIQNRPEILATLYHTGKSREKAKELKEKIDRSKKEKKPRPVPVPDEMGGWILEHLQKLRYLFLIGSK